MILKVAKSIKGLLSAVNKINLTCNLCGKEIFDGGYFCEKCLKFELAKSLSPICACCGRRVGIDMERCVSCKDGWSVDFARSVYPFESGIEELIKRYKYNNNQYLADIFCDFLVELYLKSNFMADIITFVPMTLDKVFERGFNHSKLLADKLSEKIEIECFELLEKVKETKNQAKLSAVDRQKNLLGSFKIVNKQIIADRCILIVDDVLTTGATSNAMSTLLKKAGAKRVELITLASVQRQIKG